MRLIDRIATRRPAERFNPNTASSAAFMTYGGDISREQLRTSFMSYAQDGYAGNPVVFAIILARISILSEARFVWRGLSDKKLFGTTELSILENPWPNGTTGELIARMEQDSSLTGNAYVRKIGGVLERLRPDWVSIISEVDYSTGQRSIVGYIYKPGDAKGISDVMVPIEEMCHWSPIPDPIASYRGMSWMTPVVREINADTAMTRHKGKFFDNAATPNALVKYPQKLPKDIREEVQERLHLRHGGADNAYKTLILDAGADFTVIGNSFEQMNFSSVQAAGENRIAAAAGVPGIVPGLKEGLAAATYSNYQQAMRRFADLTARPLWRSMSAALSVLVEAPVGANLWYDTTDIAALQEGELERAQILLVRAQTYVELVKAGGDRTASAAVAATGENLESLEPTGNVFLPGAPAYFIAGQVPTEVAAGIGEAVEPPEPPEPPEPEPDPTDPAETAEPPEPGGPMPQSMTKPAPAEGVAA